MVERFQLINVTDQLEVVVVQLSSSDHRLPKGDSNSLVLGIHKNRSKGKHKLSSYL
jgi:hypothetical protein